MSTIVLTLDDFDEITRPRRKRPARSTEKYTAIREAAGWTRKRTHPKGR